VSEPPTATLARQAAQLLQAGRLDEAVEEYRRLVAVQPEAADNWYNLAYAQGCARRFDEALASYQQALDRGIGGAEDVHVNRSVILDHLERRAEAEAELRAALAIRPDFVTALLNLGLMQEDRGARGEARTSYEGVLSADPDNCLAMARLVGLSGKLERNDPLLARMQAVLERQNVAELDRATLGFALGQALDSAGSYDEAFHAFESANRANEAHAARSGMRYDPEAHAKFVDRLITAFAEPASGPNYKLRRCSSAACSGRARP
jgi:tetratricopeptide (TPR) repeat protein